jgi:hypothetical protein
MFLVNFVCDFVERRGEKPSASTRVRIMERSQNSFCVKITLNPR